MAFKPRVNNLTSGDEPGQSKMVMRVHVILGWVRFLQARVSRKPWLVHRLGDGQLAVVLMDPYSSRTLSSIFY